MSSYYVLKIQYVNRPPETRNISAPTTTIGRESGDVVLNDPQTSGRHAEILFQNNQVRVRDAGSTNGTWFNGQRLTEFVLEAGQWFQAGQTTLQLMAVHGDQPSAPAKTMMAMGGPPPAQPPGSAPQGWSPPAAPPPAAPPSSAGPPSPPSPGLAPSSGPPSYGAPGSGPGSAPGSAPGPGNYGGPGSAPYPPSSPQPSPGGYGGPGSAPYPPSSPQPSPGGYGGPQPGGPPPGGPAPGPGGYGGAPGSSPSPGGPPPGGYGPPPGAPPSGGPGGPGGPGGGPGGYGGPAGPGGPGAPAGYSPGGPGGYGGPGGPGGPGGAPGQQPPGAAPLMNPGAPPMGMAPGGPMGAPVPMGGPGSPAPMGNLGGLRPNFNGAGGELFVTYLVGALLTSITFGIYAPWFSCKLVNYVASNTTLGPTRRGELRLEFTGTGGELFVTYLVGGLLTMITLGIYSPWFICKLLRFFTNNTVATAPDGTRYRPSFEATGGELFVQLLVGQLLTMITFGIYFPWFLCKLNKLILSRMSVLENEQPVGTFDFEGKGGELFVTYLVGGLLTGITFGIYMPWFLVKIMRFVAEGLRVSYQGRMFAGSFHGTGGEFFVTYLVGALLTGITFGIYAPWFMVKLWQFQFNNHEFAEIGAASQGPSLSAGPGGPQMMGAPGPGPGPGYPQMPAAGGMQ